ncbi:MAG: hypothetical protein AAGE52_33815 [Myxococcota bacterium]
MGFLCGAGFLASGLLAIGLWEWVRHAPSSQCYGLSSTWEIGVVTFYVSPITSAKTFASPFVAGAFFVGLPLMIVTFGCALALRWREIPGGVLMCVGWVAYGFASFAIVAIGC